MCLFLKQYVPTVDMHANSSYVIVVSCCLSVKINHKFTMVKVSCGKKNGNYLHFCSTFIFLVALRGSNWL